jgi:general secretion pathway protein G
MSPPRMQPASRTIAVVHRLQRGFTLIELVITVAIVGILASMALPMGDLVNQRAQEQELRSALRQIRSAIDAYKHAVDEGRIARRVDSPGYPPALEDLVNGVEDAKSPTEAKIYFLRRLPRDPFAADAQQPAALTWGLRSYASPPDAPAQGSDVFDVYSRSERIGLNGQAYRDW